MHLPIALVLFSLAGLALSVGCNSIFNRTIDYVIIGGGPTGMGAAWRLHELGNKCYRVFERNNHVGGLSSSLSHNGFIWDLGGHVYFSHYTYFTDLFHKLVPKSQFNQRAAYVRIHQRWVPYPFQNNLKYLPKQEATEALESLEQAQKEKKALLSHNFDEFMDRSFGKTIAQIFLRPYNFKVWAHPATLMNKEWIGERVAVIDVERARENILQNKDDLGWGPNNQFEYAYGGTGELFEEIRNRVKAHVQINHNITKIDFNNRRLCYTHPLSKIEMCNVMYKNILSTMPLDILIRNVLVGPIPDGVWYAAGTLRHSGAYIVGIGIEGQVPRNWSWMYFPESDTPFYRVTYLSNYSPKMTPDPTRYYSCMCEISFSEFKEVNEKTIVDDTINGLITAGVIPASHRSKIKEIWTTKIDYAYPTPSIERDSALSLIIPWLEKHGIYSRGRFGLWRYEVANTDHTTMQGVEVVNRWIKGDPEQTIHTVYS